MKKTLLILASIALTGLLVILVSDTWRTTEAIREQGREGALKIEGQYNSSRWTSPVPLKKIHTYTATLVPDHEVVVQSDQDLTSGRQYFIRFLSRENTPAVRAEALRPIAGSMRLRLISDGRPDATESTAAMYRMLAKAMEGEEPGVAASGQDRTSDSVPFLLGGANDSTLELIWANSRPGEWLLLAVLLLITKALALKAWFTPWRPRRIKADRTEFVHPTLRRIDADAPPPPPLPIILPVRSPPSGVDAPPPAKAEAVPEPLLKLPRR